MSDPLNVLFLCTGNSARSIMAECILNREGKGKFRAFSAGSRPTGKLNPFALSLLRKMKYDVCCPVWPGQPMTAPGGLPDPTKATGTDAERALAFDDCFRMLNQRIGILVNLPLDRLSKLSLQEQLSCIGKDGKRSASASFDHHCR